MITIDYALLNICPPNCPALVIPDNTLSQSVFYINTVDEYEFGIGHFGSGKGVYIRWRITYQGQNILFILLKYFTAIPL